MRTIILSSLLIVSGALGASADTFVFKDVQRPHGHERGMAAKRADAAKCGWTTDGRVLVSRGAMVRCMRAHGWVVSNYISDPTTDAENTATFTDLTGRKRGDAELHADERRCDPYGELRLFSRVYRQCMFGLGWHIYSYTPPAAEPDDEPESPPMDAPSPPSPPPPMFDDNGNQMIR